MRTIAALGLVAALTGASLDKAGSVELMTADGYLLALSQDDASRSAAEQYAAGTLDALLVVNEVTATEDSRLFCISDERASVLDAALLRSEFGEWLRDPTLAAAAGPDVGALPLAAVGLVFLRGKFPCEGDQAAPQPDPGTGLPSRLLQPPAN